MILIDKDKQYKILLVFIYCFLLVFFSKSSYNLLIDIFLRICMPKLKTHSSVKKRFRVNAAGKVKRSQACRQHLMRRRSSKMLRNSRGMAIVEGQESKNILKHFLPYAN
jgi:large subunit ribosomal protein L35